VAFGMLSAEMLENPTFPPNLMLMVFPMAFDSHDVPSLLLTGQKR